MNERIRELAEQAGAVEAKTLLNIPGDLVLVGNEEIQKFAQLILREFALDCMDMTGQEWQVVWVTKKWGVEL